MTGRGGEEEEEEGIPQWSPSSLPPGLQHLISSSPDRHQPSLPRNSRAVTRQPHMIHLNTHHLIIHHLHLLHLHHLLLLSLPLYEMIKHQYIFSSTDWWLVDDGGFVFICCYNYQHRNTTIASDFYVIILRAMFEFPSAEQICTYCL